MNPETHAALVLIALSALAVLIWWIVRPVALGG